MFRCRKNYHVSVDVADGLADKSLNPVVPILFPMYVISVRELVMMKEVKPMQVLQRAGIVIEYTPGMTIIFVSHQWVGKGHPAGVPGTCCPR